MYQLHGFSHILLDDGEPIGVAKDIEEIHGMELGRIILFEWPLDSGLDYRPMEGRERIEMSDASSDLLQEVQYLLSIRAALV